MTSRFLEEYEIDDLRDRFTIGKNVKIARTAVIDCEELEIGDNTLISDFAILTGKIKIGRFCHIAHKVHLSGHYNIVFGNYVTIGANSTFYTESDDHKGLALIGPQIPYELRSCYRDAIIADDFVNVASNCIVMPGALLMEGCMLKLRTNVIGRTLTWSVFHSPTPSSNCEFIRERPEDQKRIAKEMEKCLKNQ